MLTSLLCSSCRTSFYGVSSVFRRRDIWHPAVFSPLNELGLLSTRHPHLLRWIYSDYFVLDVPIGDTSQNLELNNDVEYLFHADTVPLRKVCHVNALICPPSSSFVLRNGWPGRQSIKRNSSIWCHKRERRDAALWPYQEEWLHCISFHHLPILIAYAKHLLMAPDGTVPL